MGDYKKYRYKEDYVVVDFEQADLGSANFFTVNPDYTEKGFVFSPDPAPGFIASADTQGLFGSTVFALQSLAHLGNGSQPNQALTPVFFQPFPDDLVITYLEQDDWDEPAEQEDFKFKGCYVAGLEASANAITEFEITFTGLYEGKVVGEFTTLATSGGFVKSQIKSKIDTLIIGNDDPSIGFFVDNLVFDT